MHCILSLASNDDTMFHSLDLYDQQLPVEQAACLVEEPPTVEEAVEPEVLSTSGKCKRSRKISERELMYLQYEVLNSQKEFIKLKKQKVALEIALLQKKLDQ